MKKLYYVDLHVAIPLLADNQRMSSVTLEINILLNLHKPVESSILK